MPNAKTPLPPEAGARHEQRLEAVRCSAVFGWGCSVGPPTVCPLHGTRSLGVASLRALSHPEELPRAGLLEDLVREDQERWWHRDPECLGGLEVDHQRELRGLLDWQVARLRPFQDLVHEDGGTVPHAANIRGVG